MTKALLLTLFFLASIAILPSCTESSSYSEYQDTAEAEEDNNSGNEYEDGVWCADVEYYNPNTGTRNNYDLEVEVENDELIQIEWPNGGWLDDSHFSAEDISSGECSFTSDRGYEYTITLNSKGSCGGSDAYRMKRDIEQDEEDITCPTCGDSKETYDDLCYSCERKKEEAETCRLCNGLKMEWENICSSCEADKEEEENY